MGSTSTLGIHFYQLSPSPETLTNKTTRTEKQLSYLHFIKFLFRHSPNRKKNFSFSPSVEPEQNGREWSRPMCGE